VQQQPITPTLRVYLTDFIDTDYELRVINSLTRCGNIVSNMKVFIWYDEELDKVNPTKFIGQWEKSKHTNFKTIIRPHLTDDFSEFIWYDILPHKIYTTVKPRHSRFTYVYSNGGEGILQGLKEFNSIYNFVSMDKPIRTQKRNDYESSTNR